MFATMQAYVDRYLHPLFETITPASEELYVSGLTDDILEPFETVGFAPEVFITGTDGADRLKLKQRFYFFSMEGNALQILKWSDTVSLARGLYLSDMSQYLESKGNLGDAKPFDLFFSGWINALYEEFTFTTESRQNRDGEAFPINLDISQVIAVSNISHIGFSVDFEENTLWEHVLVAIPSSIDYYKHSVNFEGAEWISVRSFIDEQDESPVELTAPEKLLFENIAAAVSPAMWFVEVTAE